MENYFDEQMLSFWFSIMEKLDTEDNNPKATYEVMNTLAEFFEFEDSFIYASDHKGYFLLADYFSNEFNALPTKFHLEETLNTEFIEELKQNKLVNYTNGAIKTELDLKLSKNILNVESFLLLPILGDQNEIVALVGLINQVNMYEELDFNFAYAVLVVIANHVRLQIYQDRIKRTEKALASIVDNMGVDIYVNDFFTHEVLYVNRSMAAPYGGVNAMQGNICWKVLYDDKIAQCEYCPQFKLIDQDNNPTKIYSWNYKRPFDGAWFRVLSAAFEWVDGRIAHIVSSIDITENIKNEETIKALAESDLLTRLPNRRKLYEDLESYMMKAKENNEGYHVIFFDLDKFKQVNDNYGHRAGDELLGLVGEFLQDNAMTKNISYRYGGDEFVLLYFKQKQQDVIKTAKMLVQRFLKPWKLYNCEVICPISIGIASYPNDGDDVITLLSHADDAMYTSKANKKEPIHLYNQGNYKVPKKLLLK